MNSLSRKGSQFKRVGVNAMTIVNETVQTHLLEVQPLEDASVTIEAPQEGTAPAKKSASKKPRSQKTPALADTSQPAPASTQKATPSDVHAKDESERIYTILSPLVHKTNG